MQILKKIFNGFRDHLEEDVEIKNISEEYGSAGHSRSISRRSFQKLTNEHDLSEIGFFKFQNEVDLNGLKHLFHELDIQEKMDLKFIVHAEDALRTLESDSRSR